MTKQGGGVPVVGPAPVRGGRLWIVPGGVRVRDLWQLGQVHQAGPGLGEHRLPRPPRPSGPPPARPRGVALVEIPQNVLYRSGEESTQRAGAHIYSADELRAQGDPRAVKRAIETSARRRASAAGGRRRGVLVRCRQGPTSAGAGRVDVDPGVQPPRRSGGSGRGPSSRRAGSVEETLHQPGRCGDQLRVPVLERGALRPTADVGVKCHPRADQGLPTRARRVERNRPMYRSSATPSSCSAR